MSGRATCHRIFRHRLRAHAVFEPGSRYPFNAFYRPLPPQDVACRLYSIHQNVAMSSKARFQDESTRYTAPSNYSQGQDLQRGPEIAISASHEVNVGGAATDITLPVFASDLDTPTHKQSRRLLFQRNLLSSWRYAILRWIAADASTTATGNGIRSLLELQDDNSPQTEDTTSGTLQHGSVMPKDQYEQYEQVSYLLAAKLSNSAASGLKCLEELRLPPLLIRRQLDALVYIKRAHETELAKSVKLRTVYGGLLRETVTNMGPSILFLSKRHIDVLLEELKVKEVNVLLKDRIALSPTSIGNAHTSSADERLPQGTILRLVDFYTLNNQVDAALALLRELPAELLTASAPEVLQRCTNLLKRDTVETVAGTENFKILPKILQLGISVDVPIFTVAIQNAFGAGKSGVAWDLFRFMQSEGLDPHPMTYLALLRNSYVSKDVRGLNEILTQIHEREEISSNPWLACCLMNIVRVVSRYERGDSWQKSFEHMMSIYDRAFDRSVLQKLQISLVPVASVKAATAQPSPEFLSYIIWLYVVNCTKTSVVHGLWRRLTDLLKDNDPYILEAARFPAFYDGFVLSYSLYARNLPHCLRVIYSMLEHQRCSPTKHTWSILVDGLLKHRHTEDLLNLETVMKAQPSSPAKDAWEEVLSSKVIAPSIADAMDELKGFERSFDGPVGLLRDDAASLQR